MAKPEITIAQALEATLKHLTNAAEGAYDIWSDIEAAEGASQAFEEAKNIVREEFKKVTTF